MHSIYLASSSQLHRTKAESEPTPVTFTDFFNYSVLRSDEIDSSVFGHTHPFRKVKRRYVFEIVYGRYDQTIAEREAELRTIELELQFLRGESAAATRIFAGTELESIEAVRVAREGRSRSWPSCRAGKRNSLRMPEPLDQPTQSYASGNRS
jgi:hypothetical protein